MAELLTDRWTLVVGAGWLLATAAFGRCPAWLGYPGIAFAWGLGMAHNLGLRVDLGAG